MISLLIVIIRLYQGIFSKILTQIGLSYGSGCRFQPTCSHYAQLALDQYGWVRGLGLTARRILRCHPWAVGKIDYPNLRNNSSY